MMNGQNAAPAMAREWCYDCGKGFLTVIGEDPGTITISRVWELAGNGGSEQRCSVERGERDLR